MLFSLVYRSLSSSVSNHYINELGKKRTSKQELFFLPNLFHLISYMCFTAFWVSVFSMTPQNMQFDSQIFHSETQICQDGFLTSIRKGFHDPNLESPVSLQDGEPNETPVR